MDKWQIFVKWTNVAYALPNVLLLFFTVPRMLIALFQLFYTGHFTETIAVVQIAVASLLILSRIILMKLFSYSDMLVFNILCLALDLLSLVCTLLIFSSLPLLHLSSTSVLILVWYLMQLMRLVDIFMEAKKAVAKMEWWQQLGRARGLIHWIRTIILALALCAVTVIMCCVIAVARLTHLAGSYALNYHHHSSPFYAFYRKVLVFLARRDDKESSNEVVTKLFLTNQLLCEYLLKYFVAGTLYVSEDLSLQLRKEKINQAVTVCFQLLESKQLSDTNVFASDHTVYSGFTMWRMNVEHWYLILFPVLVWLVTLWQDIAVFNTFLLLYWTGLVYSIALFCLGLLYLLQTRHYYFMCSQIFPFHSILMSSSIDTELRAVQAQLFESTYRVRWNNLRRENQQRNLYDPQQDLFVTHLQNKEKQPHEDRLEETHRHLEWYRQIESRWCSLRSRKSLYYSLVTSSTIPVAVISIIVSYESRETAPAELVE